MAAPPQAAALVAATRDAIPEEPRTPSIAPSLTFSEESEDQEDQLPVLKNMRPRRASTRLIAQSAADIQRITGESAAEVIDRCCGGNCCMNLNKRKDGVDYEQVPLPENDAFKSLALRLSDIPTKLTNIEDLPEQTVFFKSAPKAVKPAAAAPSPADSAVSVGADNAPVTTSSATADQTTAAASLPQAIKQLSLENINTAVEPPSFVQPHPPNHVWAARIADARILTKAGAEKRTYHFDIDITNYPEEDGTDFRVGGAIGVSPANDPAVVNEVFDALLVPRFLRDKPVVLKTTKGRWPTVWGDDQARELTTTRRDLLSWCSDLLSYPPSKPLLRVLAENALEENEKKILTFLCSAEGHGVFCTFRNGPPVTIPQLLAAFPSSHPPLDQFLSVLQPLMPRFYSLSNDPHVEFQQRDTRTHRLAEIAVTVQEVSNWRGGQRTGPGSGFMERRALEFIEAKERGETPEVYIPMFKGLMANPLASRFVTDGPMLLIGAGVGIAPFRGFVQRRLKTANCANKVWVLQGIRDSLVDEIYSGEWGVHEDEVKRVVQSRKAESRYVQEEVKHQADLVWHISNSLDGRVFVCGSSKGMSDGVEESLVDVAMKKGNLEKEEAKTYWQLKKEAGQLIMETW